MYSASLSYRCEDALVRQSSDRRQGGSSEGNEPGIHSAGSVGREVYDCMASSAVGAGSSSGA